MEQNMNTNITMRVQANDGMFLGPDSFNGGVITITDTATGKQLATGLTSPGDSGTRVSAPNANTSPYPILTPGSPPTTYWVQAATTTANFTTSLSLSAPTTLEVAARIPLPPAQGDQYVSGKLQVTPGQDPTNGAGFVLIVPGLWVQPEIVNDGLQMRIRAKVTMMCGCELNTGSPWLPTDFSVQASVVRIEPYPKFIGTYPMTFQVNSQFYADITLATAGTYDITIEAMQQSISNLGTASTRYTVTT